MRILSSIIIILSMDPAHTKNELFQKSIRRQQLDSYFQQQRRVIGTIGNQKQLNDKNKSKLQSLITNNNLTQIYQCLKDFNMELIPALLLVTKQLFGLIMDQIKQVESLYILSLLIIHCYEQVKPYLKSYSIYQKVLTDIYICIQQKNQTRLKILLTILKNLATRYNEQVNHKQFVQHHFPKLYQSLCSKPTFLIFLAYVSQQQRLPFQPLFSNIYPIAMDSQVNVVIRISTIVIIMNQLTKCQYKELQPHLSHIILLLKNTYKEKNKFTVSLRHNCLQKIGQLIQKIPVQSIQNSSFLKDWQTLLFPFLSLLKQIEPLAVKKIIYEISGIVVNKLKNQKKSVFERIINNQMIGLIISGLDYTDSQILRLSLKNLLMLTQSTTCQLKILEEITEYSVDVELQNLVYHMDEFISSMAEQLLEILKNNGKSHYNIMEIEQ